jgi:hypothetical protein
MRASKNNKLGASNQTTFMKSRGPEDTTMASPSKF